MNPGFDQPKTTLEDRPQLSIQTGVRSNDTRYGSTVGSTRPDPTTRKSAHSPDDGHARAVDALRSAYAEVPAGTPVRLAKRTSNLFRFRTGVAATDWT